MHAHASKATTRHSPLKQALKSTSKTTTAGWHKSAHRSSRAMCIGTSWIWKFPTWCEAVTRACSNSSRSTRCQREPTEHLHRRIFRSGRRRIAARQRYFTPPYMRTMRRISRAKNPPQWPTFLTSRNFPDAGACAAPPLVNLEFALIADGVPLNKVYPTLNTPEGVDRAFRKLDTIKDHIVWWEAGAQPPQIARRW